MGIHATKWTQSVTGDRLIEKKIEQWLP